MPARWDENVLIGDAASIPELENDSSEGKDQR